MIYLDFPYTKKYIKNRVQTVTRRIKCPSMQPGDLFTACEKFKDNEPCFILLHHQLRVVSKQEEKLCDISQRDVYKEGFPHVTVAEYLDLFKRRHKCKDEQIVIRIEFEHIG